MIYTCSWHQREREDTREPMDIWIDGSPALRQNQTGRIAIVYGEGGTFIAEIGASTNNEAEYKALIEALNTCSEGDVIKTDSQLLFGQMAKGWRVKAENLKPLYQEAKALLDVKRCKIVLIPRSDNKAGRLLEGMPGFRHARSS